ncbi:MAG: A/G-specific adenine glycosylase [Candidatus Gracilibacteria bacterium]
MENKIAEYQKRLLDWYKQNGRDLPWRKTNDPYKILISEVMLQQTQVDRVMPKYFEFLEKFPTIEDLASASNGDVLRIWSGLGYNSRALRLKAVAEEAVSVYAGKLPDNREKLKALKGIGDYTSGAILAFAYHKPVSFIDTNIKRLVHRVFVGLELQGWRKTDKEMVKVVDEVCDFEHAYEYHQALMDLGATICKATKLHCHICPMKEICDAYAEIKENPLVVAEKRVSYKKQGTPFKESKRYIRGGVVEYLRINAEGAGFKELYDLVNENLREMNETELKTILGDLTREGMIKEEGGKFLL